ncbi:MAG: PAS domain S-box protein [Chloroflexi bacterium]|nr:PAS domain S-box protein [Chloroflexota bacterium]
MANIIAMTNHSPHIKILLIGSDSLTHQIRKLLTDSQTASVAPTTEILQAAQVELGTAYLAEIQFDTVLMSLSLPDIQITDAFNQIQTAASDTPIILLCAPDDEETAVQLMQQGAQGYLLDNQLDANVLLSLFHLTQNQWSLRKELKKTTGALQSNKANVRQILKKSADGIVIVNEKGVILFVNPIAEQILARSKQDLIGGSFDYSLTKPDTAQLDIQRVNGKTAVIEMRQAKITWQNQNAHMVSLRDISVHHRAKQELSQKVGALETRNAELNTFAQTTAHQIQGLLSQMIGYTSYLDMHYNSTLDDEATSVIRHVLRSGHKMSNVLNELLLLAYVEKEDIPITPLAMDRVVSEAYKRMAFEIEENHGKITQPDVWPVVQGYGSWIEEAWVNYISNGLKYGGDPPRLELGWKKIADDMIRFWVKDNGQGIAPADQKKLFKPHTRLHQMRATGEGLGLSIVQRIIKKCGGKVGVESALGEGSIFWFTLPDAEDDKMTR